MSQTQMGQLSVRLVKYLVENGPRTLNELAAAFPSETRRDLSCRLSNLVRAWWLYPEAVYGRERTWSVHQTAYSKLPSIGLQPVTAPPKPRGRGRPRDVVYVPAADVVPARQFNVFAAPVWRGWGHQAPVRQGALDFARLPSRGFHC